MTSRWADHPDAPRGSDYDERFQRLASAGVDMHGEATLVEHLLEPTRVDRAPSSPSVLDAGCGTGRVAIELHRRGFHTVGVDLDADMLQAATDKAPDLDWRLADLSTIDLGLRFDAVILAGNVVIFVAPGSEGDVVERCADHLVPGGLLIAGYQLAAGSFGPHDLDRAAARAGLQLLHRWTTWDRRPWPAADDGPLPGYQVSVHRSQRPVELGRPLAYGGSQTAEPGDAP